MRLEHTISFLGPISEGLDENEWNIGARSVREDTDETLHALFNGCEQDDQEKVFRMDLRVQLDDGSEHDDEPNEVGRHRVVNLRGIVAWDDLHDKWVVGGTYVTEAWLSELRRALAFYDGINATVHLTIQVAIDQSDGFNDLPEFEESEDMSVFTPQREYVAPTIKDLERVEKGGGGETIAKEYFVKAKGKVKNKKKGK